ncbi:RAD3-like DNA-binding helicase protein, putative isoform 1 [Hibiscus syriacus]|uniref:RAD3-like DNA-binding helicase protein, putative isoform 1 n=1 Tax=Hibiscus syriacus TaxID=106335 RepID=A0A6A3D6J2_HIBSY|nr:RAD3-like DNA-binding helicase protein, putative isoform 1 [Hibiscus syriacus]
MEWENQELQQAEEYLQYQIQNGVCGKVMIDEQIEELRKQIVAHASISEQLAELRKSISPHQDFTGIRLGNLYCDPVSASICQKITSRQRWTPTANRRARSKRKSQAPTASGEALSGSEDSGTKDKRTKPVSSGLIDNIANRAESIYFQNSDTAIDQLIGKVESPRILL